jgi:hypothetical protein
LSFMPSIRFKRPDTLFKCPNRVCFTLVTRQTIDGALRHLRRFKIRHDSCRIEMQLSRERYIRSSTSVRPCQSTMSSH